MADASVQALRDAFAAARDGDLTLNEAFWTSAGLTAPTAFIDLIRSAFRLPRDADGLVISYDRAAVTPVTNDAFQIPGVQLTFLSAAPDQTIATLYGTSGRMTPTLAIDVVPSGWQLATDFPAMSGWPFDLLRFTQERFLFTTADQTMTSAALNAELTVRRGQNLYGTLELLPPEIEALISLVTNLDLPSGPFMCGSIAFDKVDNTTILLPDLDLAVPLTGPSLTLFFLSIEKPVVGVEIKTIELSLPDDNGDPATTFIQTPEVFFGANLVFAGKDDTSVGATLRAGAPRDLARYDFGVAAIDSTHAITPAAVIAAIAGNNFFSAVPAVLQPYLAGVELRGFGLDGPIKPDPGITTLSILVGTVPGTTIPLFSDPSKQVFEIDGFTFGYTLLNPLRTPSGPSFARFETTLKIFPEVFRTKDGAPGGLFKITIDQALNIDGRFAGRASFGDALEKITGGAIGLPQGVDVEFSDIVLAVRPSARSYALGFQVDAALDVPFISDGGKPLIQLVGMRFKLGAHTPKADAGDKAQTVYTGSIDGELIVGPLDTGVSVAYDGAREPAVWQLAASLNQPLKLSELINRFFRAYSLPDILPGDLAVTAFDLAATVPGKPKKDLAGRLLSTRPVGRGGVPGRHHGWRSPPRAFGAPLRALDDGDDTATTYEISGTIIWVFAIAGLSIDTKAAIGLAYDATRPEGDRYSGSVIGTIKLDQIGPLEIGYRFGPATQDAVEGAPPSKALGAASDDSVAIWLAWNGFRAAYDRIQQTATFTMTGWSVGSLLTALVAMIGRDPSFSLPSPWDVLSDISLDGLAMTFHLKKQDPKQPKLSRISATYGLPSSLDLGIVKIEGLRFNQVDGKVRLGIIGSSTVPAVNASSLFKDEGQDATDMPQVPGRGNAYFDLRLLALGQRVKIYEPGAFNSTSAVIAALKGIPGSDDNSLPFDPTQRTPGQPCYDHSSDWLAAMDFGLLRFGDNNDYAIEIMVIFNDPDLYALRLALNGDKVKALAGLVIDVLYKKITDDVGCYQIEFTLPTKLRNIDIGAFSVTLPIIGVQIYTNGDFLIDFGFPYNRDFSRSFTAQGIIMGIPVTGSAGFYFGKLSNATAPNLPTTTRGTFHPVIVFGLGAQLGVGKTIDKGILKAGFMITVFGIIEGTIAAWHPFESDNRGNPNQLQGDTYFKISGVFGIIGKLYGTIDFAIIKADVNLTVEVYASIAYESFRRIPLSLTASVSVSVSISIDCGLFSIDISFSFDTTLSVELTIGQDEPAPWDGDDKALVHRTLHALAIRGPAARLAFRTPIVATPEPINLTVVPQFTVLAEEGATREAQEGAFVLLFVMDAPDALSKTCGAETSFGRLCAALFPWIIASAETHPAVKNGIVRDALSRPMLEAILQQLSDPAVAAFDATRILDFLAASFKVSVTVETTSKTGATTIFPALPVLSLAVPNSARSGFVTIDLAAYATTTPGYQRRLREIFAEVAANVTNEGGTAPEATTQIDDAEPLAASVLVDYFTLLARQLIQSGLDAFDDYAYPLDDTTSLAAIVEWADALAPGQLTATALVNANLQYPLARGHRIEIGAPADSDKPSVLRPVRYMIQTGDTLAAIAARYADPANPDGTTPADLILSGADQNNLISTGLTITLRSKTYETRAGDDFASIAKGFGVTIDALAHETSLHTLAGLLVPAVVIDVPNVKITTVGGETIQGVLNRFNVPVATLLTEANLKTPGLFAVDPSLRFAVPAMTVLPREAIWPAILRTGTLSHLSGMAARYLMHGMRLPVADGLTLPPNFLYGPPHWARPQTGYGMYQLTGQQFPFAESNSETAVILSRPTQGCDWLNLGGGASLTVPIGSSDPKVFGPKQLLAAVLGVARAEGYKPNVPVLAAEPQVKLAAKRYGVATAATWATSDVTDLIAVTTLSARTKNDTAATSQPKPILWTLSSTLLRAIETRQAALATVIAKTIDQRPFMPVLAPSIGTRDPATTVTTFAAIADFAFATRVDFKLKHLAQDVDLAPQRPDANDIVPPSSGNSGAAARPLAPFAYEIVGPSASDAVLLARILTAMDSEGEDIVSRIFLLYADPNNGADGLTSRAPSEFLAFIVQSNLATETNPPSRMALDAMASTPPSGIANKPGEFIKLLWELSTVNSGGTYLFFQLLADGGGLPPSLFDTSGLATLTLVVAFARDTAHPTGARMRNAMNALVTTMQIDPAHAIVDLTGLSMPTHSLPMLDTTTPSGITALYGVDLDGLAKSNPDTPLRPGSPIPIAGLFRQLLPSDFGHGDPLEALAEYYSAGALTPMGKADISAFNPGVSVAPFALFRIPPLVYAVSPSAPPGSTLAAISGYFATDPSTLLFAARDVAGLFADGPIVIDPIDFDVQPNLGLGNAGLSLERERGTKPRTLPPDASKSEVEAYAHATLLQLYQLVSAAIMPNAFFNASVDSAAFGPRDKPSKIAQAAEVRRLAVRRDPPPPDANFIYDQALGFRGAAKVNAAPPPVRPGLPLATANPYRGIGSILQFGLAWQDLFGNRTPAPFSTTEANTLATPILYADRPIPLDQWPSTNRSYRYDGTAGAPVLHIDLSFDPTPYNPATKPAHRDLDRVRAMDSSPIWQRGAIDDLARFTLIYFQLVQDYTPLGIPGLTGPAMTVSLHNTLLATPDQPLAASERAKLRTYVEAAILYLAARAEAKTAASPSTIDLTVAVDVQALDEATDIVALEVALDFRRDPNLCAPGLRGVPDGTTTRSQVPPHGGPSDVATVGFKAFAETFEAVFVTADWQMRIGSSATDPSQPANARATTLWSVRLSQPGGPKPRGIGVIIGGDIRYYAPLPIADQLQTLAALKIRRYVSGSPYPAGDPVVATFTNVDPNVWLAECLTALDDFLTATYTTPCFVLDRLLGFEETPAPGGGTLGYLGRLLGHKKTLAKAIASTARSVLDQPDTLRAAAIDKLEQALLRRLDTSGTLACVAVLPVAGAIYAPPLPSGRMPPRLFGQPAGTLAAKTSMNRNDNFALSTGKIALNVPAQGDASALAFLVTSRAAERQAYVELDLSYALSHIEYDIKGVPGIANYEQSRWISFLTGPFTTTIAPKVGAHFAIPVALRALPTPATVVTQTGTRMNDGSGSAADLKCWAYGFSYLLNQAAQDSVMATVEFNPASVGPKAAAMTPAQTLYADLAQFVAIHAAVARDLESVLRPINGNSQAGTPEVLVAAYAVAALETVVGAVASSYQTWADSQDITRLAASAPPRVTYTFEIALETDPTDQTSAIVHVRPQSFRQDGQDVANFLPLAKVEIDADHYEPELAASNPATGEVSWRYRNVATKTALAYEAARLDAARRIVFAPLDVLALQKASASVQVVRNRHLAPPDSTVATSKSFEFATAPSRFADPMSPFLDYGSFAVDRGATTAQPIEAWLTGFFGDLLTTTLSFKQPVLVGLETGYSYSLVPAQAAVPATRVPIGLLRPTGTAGDPKPPLVASVSGHAQAWFDTQQPRVDSSATFDFGVTIFSASGQSDMPLLRIGALTLAATNVTTRPARSENNR